MAIRQFDFFACPLYGAELRCGKRAAGVARVARGGKDVRSPVSETKRDYQVGRGKPPVHSRFKKGQSGIGSTGAQRSRGPHIEPEWGQSFPAHRG
jgi:hypothetical protein